MTDIPRQFKGVWIPAEVWLDHSLSITEKVMMVEIGSLQDPVRGCYASNSHFARFFGLSSSRVSEIISALSAKGLLRVELIRDGRQVVERRVRLSNLFGKSNTYSENAATLFGKGGDPYSEKAEESNTKSNSTNEGERAAAKASSVALRKASKFDPLTACPANVTPSVWADWCQHRKEIRKPLTATTCAKQAKTLAGHHAPDAVINQSISNGWTGLFPEKVLPGAQQGQRRNGPDFNDTSWADDLGGL
ncbi:TPA: helix-turn-helix domain-containing protein [Pseudomonas putida]|uniref:helix-turn-helix domain-containing protein n=1 Tax=Pseudomonas putida TaxID=303 RepID=UPI0023635A09|nr:helix-turn-helix domain-containing protein [Pseudomonas putida]MDD2149945.1 helix-turn-helix domain-containing protein [Pseudomonas putida]HDS1682152.1 helix-turn-helix domain-containing protein [Pseudomonas putida]